MKVTNSGLGDNTQVALSVASQAANYIPVYGQIISGALKVFSFASGLFGGHNTDFWMYADVHINNNGYNVTYKGATKGHSGEANICNDAGIIIAKNILELVKQFNGTIPKDFYFSFAFSTKFKVLGTRINKINRAEHGVQNDYDNIVVNEQNLQNLTAYLFFDCVNRNLIVLDPKISALFKVSGVKISNALESLKTLFERAKIVTAQQQQVIQAQQNAPITSVNSPIIQPVKTGEAIAVKTDDTFSNKNLITYGIGIVGLLIAAKK